MLPWDHGLLRTHMSSWMSERLRLVFCSHLDLTTPSCSSSFTQRQRWGGPRNLPPVDILILQTLEYCMLKFFCVPILEASGICTAWRAFTSPESVWIMDTNMLKYVWLIICCCAATVFIFPGAAKHKLLLYSCYVTPGLQGALTPKKATTDVWVTRERVIMSWNWVD